MIGPGKFPEGALTSLREGDNLAVTDLTESIQGVLHFAIRVSSEDARSSE